jgi:hypothetical protein
MSGNGRFERAEDALRGFRQLAMPVEGCDEAEAKRRQVVGAMERSIWTSLKSRRRARVWRIVLGFAAVVAGLVALVLVGETLWRPSAGAAELERAYGGVLLVREGRSSALGGEPYALLAGDRISSAIDGRASLRLGNGARAELGTATQLELGRVDPQEQRLRLGYGRLELSVPKLELGHTFVVVTFDTEVTVVGTHFTVEVSHPASSSGEVTSVSVTEGTVQIQSAKETRLVRAGEHWSSAPVKLTRQAPAPSDDRTPAPQALAPEARPADDQSSRPAARSAGSEARARGQSETLAEQNRRLQAAIDARNEGDDARAVRRIDELLARRPGSPLAESARVERFRALKRLSRHGEAAREAGRYLADYPQGFARDEAREIVLGPPIPDKR